MGGNLTIAGDVVAYDASGNVIEGVLLSPRSAVAILPILDAATLKTVPVTPSITGHPMGGYAVASGSCTPAIVMVTGTSEVLSQIQTISTTAVDVSGDSGILTKQVELILPPGVSLVSGNKAVSCRVVIEQVVVLAIPDVPIEVRGAGSGWKVTLGTNVRIGSHQWDELRCHGPQVFPDQGIYRCQPASACRWQLCGLG